MVDAHNIGLHQDDLALVVFLHHDQLVVINVGDIVPDCPVDRIRRHPTRSTSAIALIVGLRSCSKRMKPPTRITRAPNTANKINLLSGARRYKTATPLAGTPSIICRRRRRGDKPGQKYPVYNYLFFLKKTQEARLRARRAKPLLQCRAGTCPVNANLQECFLALFQQDIVIVNAIEIDNNFSILDLLPVNRNAALLDDSSCFRLRG